MDSYTDGLSGVWVAVADAISDEGIYMEDEHIRSLAYAVVRAYREYTDNLTEEGSDHDKLTDSTEMTASVDVYNESTNGLDALNEENET